MAKPGFNLSFSSLYIQCLFLLCPLFLKVHLPTSCLFLHFQKTREIVTLKLISHNKPLYTISILSNDLSTLKKSKKQLAFLCCHEIAYYVFFRVRVRQYAHLHIQSQTESLAYSRFLINIYFLAYFLLLIT